ncbi:hypothetical protein VTH82DRAFT_3157 [Thermothelomyces myriococcoides]
MEPTDPPSKRRTTSYADAVRGRKVPAPKLAPDGDKPAENALPLKGSAMGKKPHGEAPGEPRKKGTSSAREKGSIARPKNSRRGMAREKQPKKDSHLKNSHELGQDVRKDQETPQLSYAEAVKGKTSLKTSNFNDSEGEHTTGPVFHAPHNVPIPETPSEASSSSQCEQPDDGIESSNEPSGDVVVRQSDNGRARQQAWPNEAGSGFTHTSYAALYAGFVTEQASRNHAAHMCNSHAGPHTHHGRLGGGKGDTYKREMRRFTVGAPSHFLPASSSTFAHRVLSTSSSPTFLRAVQDNYSIEAAIQQDIMEQSEGKSRTMAEERSERQTRLIYCHDMGLISLWECQYEWDVLVTCRQYSWRVHHDILCRESEWFRARLPPKDPNGGYITLNCDSHDKMQLANALYFMYLRTSDYEPDLHLRSALDGRPLQRAVFAYIAAASVAHARARAAALRALHAAAARLRLFFDRTPPQTLRALDLAPFHAPLAAALAMAFEQPLLRPAPPSAAAAAAAAAAAEASPSLSSSSSSSLWDGGRDGKVVGGGREDKREEGEGEQERIEEKREEDHEEKKAEVEEGKEEEEDERKKGNKKEEEVHGTQEVETADMVPLRAALAHLCDVALPWLALNEGFAEALRTEWMPGGLWTNVVGDAIWFGAQGVLDEMWAVLEEAIGPREDKDKDKDKEWAAAVPGAVPAGDAAVAAANYCGDVEGGGPPTSGSKKRKRDAEMGGTREGEVGTELQQQQRRRRHQPSNEFQIWQDGHSGELAPTPRRRHPQQMDETDDQTINAERLSPEQQREVTKEYLLAPAERGGGGPPWGGDGRGGMMLQHRHNFTNPGRLHALDHDLADGNEGREWGGDDWDVTGHTATDAVLHNGADTNILLRNVALLR